MVIGNDVEIGANSTLDRACFSKTSVGDGSKIDNLVQIARNVEIGRHCIVCAQVGISGSTTIEDFVVVGGQAGLAGHLTVHRGAKIDGQAGRELGCCRGGFCEGFAVFTLLIGAAYKRSSTKVTRAVSPGGRS